MYRSTYYYLLSIEEFSSKQDEFILLRMGRERRIQSEKHEETIETDVHLASMADSCDSCFMLKYSLKLFLKSQFNQN